MTAPRILVAGIGNIFLGDDAFGVEVAWRMLRRPLPDNVRVIDFGIRSMDLVYALLDGYDATILVDAAARGGDPGTLYVIEPDSGDVEGGRQPASFDAHNISPVQVLDMARVFGGRPKRILVVGCEPATLGDELEPMIGLSAPVEAAVSGAITIIESLVSSLTKELQASAAA